MKDVQDGLRINMPDLIRRELFAIHETKDITKEQKKKYIRIPKEISKNLENEQNCKYPRNDLIEKIIKNCRGVNKCNDKINRTEKETN